MSTNALVGERSLCSQPLPCLRTNQPTIASNANSLGEPQIGTFRARLGFSRSVHRLCRALWQSARRPQVTLAMNGGLERNLPQMVESSMSSHPSRCCAGFCGSGAPLQKLEMLSGPLEDFSGCSTAREMQALTATGALFARTSKACSHFVRRTLTPFPFPLSSRGRFTL